MAAAVEAAWSDVPLSGVVVAPYGYGLDCSRIAMREAGHPLPDDNSVAAGREIMAAVQGLGPDDLVLALISGGGSAAMCLPAPGVTLEDKRATNRLLLNSGLDIRTMNAVRRRMSAIKGGRLAGAAAPARVVTLAISDIPGDDASAIASGPTAPPSETEPDLDEVVARFGSELPARVAELLSRPGRMDQVARAAPITLIATPASALDAAADIARAHGVSPIILGDAIEGESRAVAEAMAAQVGDLTQPTVLISGGETTVTIGEEKPGRGGRNTEFVLALACALQGRAGVWAIAADTDGEDGANLGAAGALAAPDTLERARTAGLDAVAMLRRHDSGSFFEALGDLVVTGPTRTNVNDFRAILIVPANGG
jgi:glycerate 2-kinase